MNTTKFTSHSTLIIFGESGEDGAEPLNCQGDITFWDKKEQRKNCAPLTFSPCEGSIDDIMRAQVSLAAMLLSSAFGSANKLTDAEIKAIEKRLLRDYLPGTK